MSPWAAKASESDEPAFTFSLTSASTRRRTGLSCRSRRISKEWTTGRPAFRSAIISWLNTRKSPIRTRPRRRLPFQAIPCRRISKTCPPRRSTSVRAALASAARIASCATVPSGQPVPTENCAISLSLLDRLAAGLARARSLLGEQDQDQGVFRALFPGCPDDQRLVQENRDRGPVQRHRIQAPLIRLLPTRELKRREEQFVSIARGADREVQDVLLSKPVGHDRSLGTLQKGRIDQRVVIELKHRLQLRADPSDFLGHGAGRHIRAGANELDGERKPPRRDVELRHDLGNCLQILFAVRN